MSRAEAAPQIVMRCDGSPTVGMGHIMRCMALAQALRSRGIAVFFAVADLPGSARTVLQAEGLPVTVIPSDHAVSDEGPGERDMAATVKLARAVHAGVVMVDHLTACPAYLRDLKDSGIRVAVIDDLAERDMTAADWVLNQNLGAHHLPSLVGPGSVTLIGPMYALVRPEFLAARRSLAREFSSGDSKVLLTFGGGDTALVCLDAMEALEEVSGRLEVRCIVASQSTGAEALARRASTSRHQVELIHDVEDMTPYMAWADLSINAAGSTCWELCCLGVPMVVLQLSRNQERNARGLVRQGCATSLGTWSPGVAMPGLAAAVEGLLENPERRAEMSSRGQALVDGLGTGRTAESLSTFITERVEGGP